MSGYALDYINDIANSKQSFHPYYITLSQKIWMSEEERPYNKYVTNLIESTKRSKVNANKTRSSLYGKSIRRAHIQSD